VTGTDADLAGDAGGDGAAVVGSPAWWVARKATPEPVRRIPVTLDRIVSAALALIDRAGLEELSMRNLAAELGTGTTTLYRNVAGKEEVLVLVVDAVAGEVRPPHPSGDIGWREVLEGLARSFREALCAHPHAVPLFAMSVPVGPNSLRGRELALGLLRERGFDKSLAADVYTAVAHHVLASALQEPMLDFRTGGLGATRALTLRAFYRSLPAEQFPHVVELADELTEHTAEEEFEFGLRCLLDGVELGLKQAGTHS
jgi:AcrR family transcriptional regulator